MVDLEDSLSGTIDMAEAVLFGAAKIPMTTVSQTLAWYLDQVVEALVWAANSERSGIRLWGVHVGEQYQLTLVQLGPLELDLPRAS